MADVLAVVGDWSILLQRDGRLLARRCDGVSIVGGEEAVSYSQATGRDVCDLWRGLFWLLLDSDLVNVRAVLQAGAATVNAAAARLQAEHSAKVRRAVAARKLADALAVDRLEAGVAAAGGSE